MKFGGTSVANLDRIKKAAIKVKSKILKDKEKVIVVVSAMSGVTNNLAKNFNKISNDINNPEYDICLLYTSPSPRDRQKSRMPSSA